MLARMTVDRVIRLIYGVSERVDDVFLRRGVVCVANGLGAELRGDLTRRMAAHAVTHHKKRATILEDILFLWHAVRDVILIAFALAANIGEFGHREAELLCHQSFLRLPNINVRPHRRSAAHDTPASPKAQRVIAQRYESRSLWRNQDGGNQGLALCITNQKAKRDSWLISTPGLRHTETYYERVLIESPPLPHPLT